jgi:hypothetical protein
MGGVVSKLFVLRDGLRAGDEVATAAALKIVLCVLLSDGEDKDEFKAQLKAGMIDRRKLLTVLQELLRVLI